MVAQGSLVHSENNIFSNAPPYLSYFVFLVFLSIVTIILDHKYQTLEQARTFINTTLSPIYFISDVPTTINQWADDTLSEKKMLATQKQQLINENLLLSQQSQKYGVLEAENQNLRNLLNMSKRHEHDKVQAAGILMLDQNRNPNEVTLDKGLADGVYLGQSVLSKEGLFGRIVHVSYKTSTALLLISPKSFTPIQIIRNSYNSTVTGNGFLDALRLMRVSKNSDIKVGDIITTSGIGGTFPKGYKVGKVISVVVKQDHFLEVQVSPFVNYSETKEVLLIWPPDPKIITEKPNKT